MKRNLNATLFFYQGDKLTTVVTGGKRRSVFRTPELPLAEHNADRAKTTGLLATDEKGSVLKVQDFNEEEVHTYSVYGYTSTMPSPRTILGFNGETLEYQSKNYLLGAGYRAYSTKSMRFVSPDSLSPFDAGGINSYAYCNGDPINFTDPTGHNPLTSLLKGLGNLLHLRKKGSDRAPSTVIQRPQSESNLPESAPRTTTSTSTSTSTSHPNLPKYSETAPQGHATQEKARNLLQIDVERLKNLSYTSKVMARRQQLKNVGRHLEGRKVQPKKIARADKLKTDSKALQEEAESIRSSPALSSPPKYKF